VRLERAFGNASRPTWSRGEQNVEVVGDFGFVVDAVAGSGTVTPPLIKRACILLVARWAADAAASAGSDAATGAIQSETIGNYSYTLFDSSGAPGATGDPEIDGPLAMYARLSHMGAV
jgi:hypothetical protein